MNYRDADHRGGAVYTMARVRGPVGPTAVQIEHVSAYLMEYRRHLVAQRLRAAREMLRKAR